MAPLALTDAGPRTVWRVGFAPAPLEWPGWQYAEDGRFPGRWTSTPKHWQPGKRLARRKAAGAESGPAAAALHGGMSAGLHRGVVAVRHHGVEERMRHMRPTMGGGRRP